MGTILKANALIDVNFQCKYNCYKCLKTLCCLVIHNEQNTKLLCGGKEFEFSILQCIVVHKYNLQFYMFQFITLHSMTCLHQIDTTQTVHTAATDQCLNDLIITFITEATGSYTVRRKFSPLIHPSPFRLLDLIHQTIVIHPSLVLLQSNPS